MSNMDTPIVYCTNCQKGSPASAEFCIRCGTALPMAPYQSVFAQNNPPPQQYQPTSQQQYQQMPSQQQYQQLPPVPIAYVQQPYVVQTYIQPAPMVNIVNPTFVCPRCQCPTIPRYETRVSSGGWAVFAVLLILFFPLFWIGLLIKETIVCCSRCGFRMR